MLVSNIPLAYNTNQKFCIVFSGKQFQKKFEYARGILKQVLEVLTVERFIFQRHVQKKYGIICKIYKKKEYKKLCFFFFIFSVVKKMKNKQKNFTKKSKKKTWNFIFYLYIEHDHSGWSKHNYDMKNNRNIVHI